MDPALFGSVARLERQRSGKSSAPAGEKVRPQRIRQAEKHASEVRERAVRVVLKHATEYPAAMGDGMFGGG